LIKFINKKLSKIADQNDNKLHEEVLIPVQNKKIEKRFIHISLPDFTKAIFILLGISILAFTFYEIRSILFLLFFSYLFAQALIPFVEKLAKFKIPRGMSVIVTFIGTIGLLSIFLNSFVPILSNELFNLGIQIQNLIESVINGETKLPAVLNWINPVIENSFAGLETQELTGKLQESLLNISKDLRGVASNAFGFLGGILNGFANAILVLFFTYFMVVDNKTVDNFIVSLFKDEYRDYVQAKSNNIKTKVGEWLQGQILLMIAVGVLTYIPLEIIGIKYSFTLAVFAGITELIPVVGPILAYMSAIPIAANEGSGMILAITIIYLFVQRIENNFLVPYIMNKTTGLHPIIVLLSMLIGYEFKGILGVIISIPLAGIIAIFYNDFIIKIHPTKTKNQ